MRLQLENFFVNVQGDWLLTLWAKEPSVWLGSYFNWSKSLNSATLCCYWIKFVQLKQKVRVLIGHRPPFGLACESFCSFRRRANSFKSFCCFCWHGVVRFQVFEAEIKKQFASLTSSRANGSHGTVANAAGPSSAAVGLTSSSLEPQDLAGLDLTDDVFLDDVDAFIARQSQPVKNELVQWETFWPSSPHLFFFMSFF